MRRGRNTGRRVLLWTRGGGTFRALLLVSDGTIAVVTLTGLLVSMLFFVEATFNAVVISLLMSLAAAGGFLALFFAFFAAIYFGALSVALFVISTVAISSVIAVLIATEIRLDWTLFNVVAGCKEKHRCGQVFLVRDWFCGLSLFYNSLACPEPKCIQEIRLKPFVACNALDIACIDV